MSDSDRSQLFITLHDKFYQALKASTEDFTWEEKADFLEALIKYVELLRKRDFTLADEFYVNSFLKKYKSKLQKAGRAKLFQYFDQEGMLSETWVISAEEFNGLPIDDRHVSNEEYETFISNILRNLINERYFHYVYESAKHEPQEEEPEGDLGDGEVLLPGTKMDDHKDFTLRRQVMFMYYLNKHYKVNSYGNKTTYARVIRFLTKGGYDSIYKLVLEHTPKDKAAYAKDLRYVRKLFQAMGQQDIVALINKDIDSRNYLD